MKLRRMTKSRQLRKKTKTRMVPKRRADREMSPRNQMQHRKMRRRIRDSSLAWVSLMGPASTADILFLPQTRLLGIGIGRLSRNLTDIMAALVTSSDIETNGRLIKARGLTPTGPVVYIRNHILHRHRRMSTLLSPKNAFISITGMTKVLQQTTPVIGTTQNPAASGSSQ